MYQEINLAVHCIMLQELQYRGWGINEDKIPSSEIPYDSAGAWSIIIQSGDEFRVCEIRCHLNFDCIPVHSK